VTEDIRVLMVNATNLNKLNIGNDTWQCSGSTKRRSTARTSRLYCRIAAADLKPHCIDTKEDLDEDEAGLLGRFLLFAPLICSVFRLFYCKVSLSVCLSLSLCRFLSAIAIGSSEDLRGV
jgi:hypothetical protein